MTLKTWKKEFYPVTAKRAAKGSVVKAVEHSIRKWVGLRPSNLKRHGMVSYWVSGDIAEEGHTLTFLYIDGQSCSLCQKFVAVNYGDCSGCPLYESRGQVRCDCTGDTEGNPYGAWRTKGDPMPMIKALRKSLKWIKENRENVIDHRSRRPRP